MEFDIDVSAHHKHKTHLSQCAECGEPFVTVSVDVWMEMCRKNALYDCHQLELAFSKEGDSK